MTTGPGGVVVSLLAWQSRDPGFHSLLRQTEFWLVTKMILNLT